jgi:hypothetical protein
MTFRGRFSRFSEFRSPSKSAKLTKQSKLIKQSKPFFKVIYMKSISSVLYIFLMVATLSCAKKPVDTPEQVATKFADPTWKADDTGKYPATMTAVIALPETLAGTATENDKLAAFINDECRGVGDIVKVNDRNLFFVLIQGLPDETNNITFKYYSSKTAYMYGSRPAVTFLVDAIYGTAENPETLEFTQLK